MQRSSADSHVLVNARVLSVPSNGQKRVAEEILRRLNGVELASPPGALASGLRGHAWEQLVLPMIARGRNLWSPSTTGPVRHPRHVVTVHDIAFVDSPEWFSRSFAMLYDLVVGQLVQHARHIVAVSDFTRRRLIEHYRADPNRVTTIYSGSSVIFRRMPVDVVATTLQRLDVPDAPYLVAFLGHDPRKNLARIVEAWRGVSARWPEARLVTFGRSSNAKVFAAAKIEAPPSSVVHVGPVSDEDLACLYAGSAGLVFPSLYEGFGLPVIEAAACGARVLTSNISALPEISPRDAILVDPLSIVEIAAGMEAMLATATTDDASAVASRIASVARFDWDAAAAEHADLFKKVFA